jgi:hypothetical protein
MSLKIISNLVNYIQAKLNVEEEDIIVKNIEIKDDCLYSIKLKIKDEIYVIDHFEPLRLIKDENYGMGPSYRCCLFVKEYNHYITL